MGFRLKDMISIQLLKSIFGVYLLLALLITSIQLFLEFEATKNDIKKEMVKEIIQTKELFTWLDEEENYFTYFSNRNRLSNLITKAAEGSKIVNIDGLFKSVKNYHRMSKEVVYDKKVFIKLFYRPKYLY